MRPTRRFGVLLAAVVVLIPALAFAQGATTGSINGTVSDNTGAVLPGVTVTATSPAQMGAQTANTNEQGVYRFPALPPGTYRLTYEIPGFSTLVREGIIVNLNFTATVNVQLQVASLQESVTVSGASPVVDVQATTVQANFTAEMLQNIPNARDLWAIIGEAPGMMVTRFDVGGSRAGTQTGYSAFGYSGQVRVQIDGVNTTEGTGAAGFYYDYGSFDEIQLGTDGNDASAATPGTQVNALVKSGGNQFKGDLYIDFENETLQGRNVDDRKRRLGIGEGSRITRYYDPNASVGGPIKRDKFWFFGSVRNQRIGVTAPGFPVENPSDVEFLTRLQNLTYKLTYQLTPNNKIGHYIQMGRKLQPNRDAGTTRYFDAVFYQDSISYAGNIDWNSIVSPQFFFNARVSTFGYNWPDLPYGGDRSLNQNLVRRRVDTTTSNEAGSFNPRRNDRRRIQFDWNGTLFKDNWIHGNHAIKLGWLSEEEGQIFKDEGFVDNIQTRFRSATGAPDFTTPYRVRLYNTPRLSENWTWHHGAFLTDQWSMSRKLTLNLGIRWDYYSSSYPEEDILPGPFRDFFYAGASLPNGYAIPATPYAGTFKVPQSHGIERYPALLAPRLGVSWDLFGDGKTVLKGSWGRYYENTGLAAAEINPVQGVYYEFAWIDRNGDRRFQLNELGSFNTSVGGLSNSLSPDLKNTYTDSASVWFERELFTDVGARVGYTYRTNGNESRAVQLDRVNSLYTLQRTFNDAGRDGIRGNADDGPPFILYDIPGTPPPSRTERRTVDGVIARDRAFDVTLTKRMAHRWMLMTNFLYNWDHDRDFIQNPNDERFNDQLVTAWAFKIFGTYEAPYGLLVSPVLRHQSGDELRREVRAEGQPGQNITLDYDVEKIGTYREDNIWIFDTRVEKRFRLRRSHAVGLFLDAYNIGNSNAAETMDTLVGRRTTTVDGQRVEYARFMRPTVILAPRVFKIGVKYSF